MNLAHFDQDGIEILIDLETGESFATISGYARMSGKDKSTISRRCTVASIELKEAQIETKTGLKTVALIPEDIIQDWIFEDSIPLAKQMFKAGVRVYLHKVAGYKVTSTATEKSHPRQLPPVRDTVDLIEATKDLLSMQSHLPVALYQVLLDGIGDQACSSKSKQSEEKKAPRRLGVAQKAEEMGYKVNEKNRGNLGKFVKAQGLTIYQQEERLCNGQLRNINVYDDGEDLEQAIQRFFA